MSSPFSVSQPHLEMRTLRDGHCLAQGHTAVTGGARVPPGTVRLQRPPQGSSIPLLDAGVELVGHAPHPVHSRPVGVPSSPGPAWRTDEARGNASFVHSPLQLARLILQSTRLTDGKAKLDGACVAAHLCPPHPGHRALAWCPSLAPRRDMDKAGCGWLLTLWELYLCVPCLAVAALSHPLCHWPEEFSRGAQSPRPHSPAGFPASSPLAIFGWGQKLKTAGTGAGGQRPVWSAWFWFAASSCICPWWHHTILAPPHRT